VTDQLPTVTLPDGEAVPAFGQGTWHMGEDRRRAGEEAAALRLGIELGLVLIDTAEMYGGGHAEEIVAEASRGVRDKLFIVSKVLPYNASQRGVVDACERSLKRLGTDRIDLYLLHWRGSVPLAETVEGFETLRRAGKIRHWGVSNFDTADMVELVEDAGGAACATNQILYNIARRGPEFDLLPWLAEHRMPAMAYSPVDHARLPKRSPLDEIARERGVSVMRVALAWVLAQPGVFAIPKASRIEHVRDNRAALDLVLTDDERAQLDAYFRPPRSKRALEML
jgi:diketogulonate reductase-like aldo/keto reductase